MPPNYPAIIARLKNQLADAREFITRFDELSEEEIAASKEISDLLDELPVLLGESRATDTAEINVPAPHVILYMDGGLVHHGVTSEPVNLTIFDYDIEGAEEDRIVDVQKNEHTGEGFHGKCVIVEPQIYRNAEQVAALLKAVRYTEEAE